MQINNFDLLFDLFNNLFNQPFILFIFSFSIFSFITTSIIKLFLRGTITKTMVNEEYEDNDGDYENNECENDDRFNYGFFKK